MKNLFGKITSKVLTFTMLAALMPSAPVFAEPDASSPREPEEIVLKTVFDAPSKDWESECTQLGNGFLGAMIYGGYAVDQIQINENTVWDGGPSAQNGYAGGNNLGTEKQNYTNLSKLREYLQGTMKDFTDNKSSYIDSSGKVVSNDYPDLSSEAQGWLDSLKGPKTYFGHYYPTGDIYVADYLTPDIRKTINCTVRSNETGNITVENLTDGDASTDWVSINTDMPVTAEITYDESVTFKAYKMTSSALRGSDGNAPSSWKLYGSEDGSTYSVIDTRSNVKFDSLGASEIFELDNDVSYKYLRLEILRTNKNGSVVKLSELSFLSGEEFEAETAVYSDYRRELDMNNAIASVTYKKNGVKYDREYFISYPNNFMAMRLKADKDNALDKYIYLNTILADPDITAEIKDNIGIVTMTLEVGSQAQREKVACQLRIVADDDAMISYDSTNAKYIHVENADEIRVYMTAGTNYVECMDDTFNYFSDENPLDKVSQRLDIVEKQDYNTQKSVHKEDYRELFTRVNLSLNGAEFPEYMTKKELIQGYKGGTNTDSENRYLEMLYYQMGRYLMIAGSREGSLPSNLQGIWNESTNPPWRSGYTTNINAQMNYWLAETTNLSECHEPLTTFIKAQVPRGRLTAQTYHYDVNEYEKTGEFKPARGWTCYHNLNIWGNTGPDKSSCFYFPTAAAWLCQHIWEHYAFSLDKNFLQDNFYILKEASLFWVDNLVTDERDNTLVSSPGHSPEHGGISMGTTGDQVIIWELFNDTLQAAEVLEISDSEIDEIKDAMSRLSMPKIGKAGQFQEWKDEVTLDISGHNGYKHVTHMFALYPGSFVVPGRSEQDDEYAEALRESLRVRGDGGTGWGKAWKIGLWARARNGERAGRMVSSILSGSTMFNLFDTHTPFQIDGNFGATAGMTEMLLQSQGDSIELMPAVPAMWRSGSVQGLRARGGVTVGIDWKNSALTDAILVSDVDNDELSVSYSGIANMGLYDSEGDPVEFASEGKDEITFAAAAGETYVIGSKASSGDDPTDAPDGSLAVTDAKAYTEDGKTTRVLLTFNKAVPADISVYYAAYDNSGRIISVSKNDANGYDNEITVDTHDTDNASNRRIYIWDDSMKPVIDAIDISKLPTDAGGASEPTDSPEPTDLPSSEYLIDENFDNIRGSWGFKGNDRTYVADKSLKFEGGGINDMDIKTMDSTVADREMLDIEFDWRNDTDLSSSGRSVTFELADKNDRVFFALYANTRNSEGIKYSTIKSAYGDDDLAYNAFPVAQSKNSDWYHVALTVNFANHEITSGTVTRGGNTILELSHEPIEAVNFNYMKMIDSYSVSGMSLDNVKVKKADISSDDTSLTGAVIKGRAATIGTPASSADAIDDFGYIRVNGSAAINPYKLTEFTPGYGGTKIKAVKYAADETDYSGFDTDSEYNDENIENGDVFIIKVTAANGDTAYYGIKTEVTDGSEDAFLTDFSVKNGDVECIKNFVYDTSSEEEYFDYGVYEVASDIDEVTVEYVTSDERLMGEDPGKGGVTVNVTGGSYDSGVVFLGEGENIIEVVVTSYDSTESKTYTITINRTDYILLENFDNGVPNWCYSQYTTISSTEDGTLLLEQGGGSGPRSARGWFFESSPLISNTVEVDFDLKMNSGNNSNGGAAGFYLVGSNSGYTGNAAFNYTGGITGIYVPANTSAVNSMSILSGSGNTAEPEQTQINNPAGESRSFPWMHVNMVIDFETNQTAIKITSRDYPSEVWFDGTVDGFIDPSVSDFKGIQLTMGRANGNQELDNLKVRQY